MSFSYSGDPASSPVDQLRFTTQDTDPAFPLLNDEELAWLADQWLPAYGSLTFVASVAAATIARKFTGVVSVSADGVSVNTSELAERYTKMAAGLRAEYKAEAVDVAAHWNDEQPRRFRVGLHDNIEAAGQDYGNTGDDPYATNEYLSAYGVFP